MTMNIIHAAVLAGLVFVGALLAFQRGQLQELAGARAKVEAAQAQTAEALNRANRGEPKETPQP